MQNTYDCFHGHPALLSGSDIKSSDPIPELAGKDTLLLGHGRKGAEVASDWDAK